MNTPGAYNALPNPIAISGENVEKERKKTREKKGEGRKRRGKKGMSLMNVYFLTKKKSWLRLHALTCRSGKKGMLRAHSTAENSKRAASSQTFSMPATVAAAADDDESC